MLPILLLGLGFGVLIGLMGVGGGVVLVPALVYVVKLNQHLAQGTSLLIQLPPIGLGALYVYWRKGNVNLRAGMACAAGCLVGGYFGSVVAIRIAPGDLRALFGVFLMIVAAMLLREALVSGAKTND